MPGWLDRLLGASAPGTPSPSPCPPPTAPLLDADDPRLPSATRARVARLLAIVGEVEARVARDPLLAAAATETRLLRDRHLPRLVESYAAIPPSRRAEIFRATGRSASLELAQAIDLLIARAEEIAAAAARDDIEDFRNALRFIDQRYGQEDPLG